MTDVRLTATALVHICNRTHQPMVPGVVAVMKVMYSREQRGGDEEEMEIEKQKKKILSILSLRIWRRH